MKGAYDPNTTNMVTITIGFTSYKVWYEPFTPLSSAYGEESSNSKRRSLIRFVTSTIVVGHGWYVWNHQGIPPIFEVVSIIEVDDFIYELHFWCDMQQMRNPKLFKLLMAWKDLFSQIWKGSLWMIIMSLKVPMNLRFKSGICIGCPIVCLLWEYMWSQLPQVQPHQP